MSQVIIRPVNIVEAQEVERSKGATIQVLLGPDQGMPNFYTRQFTLESGGYIPLHRHENIEHQQVILEGEMLLRLEDAEHKVQAGHAIYIPAKTAHAYRNPGPRPVRFICVVPATAEYSTEWIPAK